MTFDETLHYIDYWETDFLMNKNIDNTCIIRPFSMFSVSHIYTSWRWIMPSNAHHHT